MNKNRLEAFSDGVIAIIITIIVLDIPMPESIDKEGILNLVINLGIFFIAFMVIGAQWVKHHMLFSFSETVSIKVVWRNLIYLFFLSMMPFFIKWIIESPNKVIPTLAYDIVFLLVSLSFKFMFNAVIEECDDKFMKELYLRKKSERLSWIFIFVYSLLIIFIFLISLKYPTISIVFFIVIPMLHSLAHLWIDHNFKREIDE